MRGSSSHLLSSLAGFFMLCCAGEALAQPIDSVRAVILADSSSRTFSIYLMGGASPIADKALNSFAAANGFSGELFSPDLLGGSFILTEGIQLRLNHWVIAPEVCAILTNPHSSGNRQLRFGYWGIQTIGGYVVYRSDRLDIYPLVGFGARFNQLRFSQNIGATMQGTLDDTSARSLDFVNASMQIEGGLGIDYTFPLSHDERTASGLLVGLRVGYAFGIGGEQWTIDNREVSGGPDMRASGLTVGLKIGYSTQQRIYDAKIVAERGGPPAEH
jgi:hypothetical protein